MSTCRLCKLASYEHHEPMFKYGVRHYAHASCAINAWGEDFLLRLPSWQIGELPWRLVQQYGLRESPVAGHLFREAETVESVEELGELAQGSEAPSSAAEEPTPVSCQTCQRDVPSHSGLSRGQRLGPHHVRGLLAAGLPAHHAGQRGLRGLCHAAARG
jgi:hypothetical protein